jgi:hypothetical protein
MKPVCDFRDRSPLERLRPARSGVNPEMNALTGIRFPLALWVIFIT